MNAIKVGPQNLVEKILSQSSKQGPVQTGDIGFFTPDIVMVTDATFPLVEKSLESMGESYVARPEKLVLVNDHFVPARDIRAAEMSKRMRSFAEKHKIESFFEVGRSGISHVLLPNQGISAPLQTIVGADSHTVTNGALGIFAVGVGSTDAAIAIAFDEIWLKVPPTIRVVLAGTLPRYVTGKDIILTLIKMIGTDGARYMAIEFCGEAIESMHMDDRFTLANMTAEAGAKAGLIAPDALAYNFHENAARKNNRVNKLKPRDYVKPDIGASYAREVVIDVSQISPVVALPPSPENVIFVSQAEKIKVNQVIIGSCTNGRMSDFRAAAQIIKGRSVHPNVRLIIAPGDSEIALALVKEGLAETFLAAGAVISPPSCGACIGGSMGVLGDHEVGVFTTSRNFIGRSGSKLSNIYLVNPWVAAATAITGELTDPINFIEKNSISYKNPYESNL
jgi:3-isopropylmalate/(R)-2-methylmalate dehydratase large subunit